MLDKTCWRIGPSVLNEMVTPAVSVEIAIGRDAPSAVTKSVIVSVGSFCRRNNKEIYHLILELIPIGFYEFNIPSLEEPRELNPMQFVQY